MLRAVFSCALAMPHSQACLLQPSIHRTLPHLNLIVLVLYGMTKIHLSSLSCPGILYLRQHMADAIGLTTAIVYQSLLSFFPLPL
jgi:hypothetical protein